MDFVKHFRDSAPYLQAHRGSTLVVWLPGELLQDVAQLNQLAQDLLLLHTLGVRLVLVPGCRPQIEQRLAAADIQCAFYAQERITSAEALPFVLDAVGDARLLIEAALTRGLANAPGRHAPPAVISGNFVLAQPLGVRDGVDFQYTGILRRVNHQTIEQALDIGSIVLVSPIGNSPSGEQFNLSSQALAVATAAALSADKLVLFSQGDLNLEQGQRALTAQQAREMNSADGLLASAADAVSAGVSRVHIVDAAHDGALLQELFTRDGNGVLVSNSQYDSMQRAGMQHIPGILALIEPLEQAGVLIERNREQLELELDRFVVQERDGMVVGCAALAIFEATGNAELYCFAVHADYRGRGLARDLVAEIERNAREANQAGLFVLTTRTDHWFRENGFEAADLDVLPEPRRASYNHQRNAKIYAKSLS